MPIEYFSQSFSLSRYFTTLQSSADTRESIIGYEDARCASRDRFADSGLATVIVARGVGASSAWASERRAPAWPSRSAEDRSSRFTIARGRIRRRIARCRPISHLGGLRPRDRARFRATHVFFFFFLLFVRSPVSHGARAVGFL